MAKRYEIWDKVSPMITPKKEYYTAEEWMEKFPAARHITCVCQAGELKGYYFESLEQMKSAYGEAGCDFSNCTTDEEILDAIEAFEDAMNTPSTEVSAEERIAAALEAQNLMAMEDVT